MLEIKMYHQDCMDLLKSIPDNSIDFVCTDPPYTDGKGNNVLGKHKIQTNLDLEAIAKEFYRVAKPNTFYAFFGQMPTIIEWYNAAVKAGFKFRIDIIWAKRRFGSPYMKIGRTKELIYVFSKGNAIYQNTKKVYEDLKLPLLEIGLIDIKSIDVYIKDLRNKKDGIINPIKRNAGKVNDKIYEYGNALIDRSPEYANITDVWSFSPNNTSNLNVQTGQIKHPTVKPIPLLERLIELCTPANENITVLDCFAGSATTALACQNTNRNFVGCEIDNDYYNICIDRIEKNRIKLCQ